MSLFIFPALPLASWQRTRDTIQSYAQVVGKIRRAMTPVQKHWWHISLRTTAAGLSTTPIPAEDKTFEILLDFTAHQLRIMTSSGENTAFPINGQSTKAFKDQLLSALAGFSIHPTIDQDPFQDDSPGVYDQTAVSKYWRALSQIDSIFKEFRHTFRQESSPVQLWPHHLDLAVVWFSGRLIPDQDPNDPEWSDEQLNFGFSTGDSGIPLPYFYITAYPLPDGLTDTVLPEGAYWWTDGWTGAILPYAIIAGSENGKDQVLEFLRIVHQAGSKLMQDGLLTGPS